MSAPKVEAAEEYANKIAGSCATKWIAAAISALAHRHAAKVLREVADGFVARGEEFAKELILTRASREEEAADGE